MVLNWALSFADLCDVFRVEAKSALWVSLTWEGREEMEFRTLKSTAFIILTRF